MVVIIHQKKFRNETENYVILFLQNNRRTDEG